MRRHLKGQGLKPPHRRGRQYAGPLGWLLLPGLALAASQASAQTIIGPGGAVPSSIGAGATLVFQGDATLTGDSALPTSATTVNFQAASGSTIISMVSNGHFTSNGGTGGLTLNLTGGDFVLQNGARPAGSGGAIQKMPAGAGGLTINTDATLSLIGNTAGVFGGAIYSDRTLTINGSLIAQGNTALSEAGGAIHVQNGDLTIIDDSGAGVITIDNNVGRGPVVETDAGGGLSDDDGILRVGDADDTIQITNNYSGYLRPGGVITVDNTNSNGGGIRANNGSATTANVILTGQSIALSNNHATRHGGAIYTNNGAEITGPLVMSDNEGFGDGGAIKTHLGSLLINTTGTGATTITGNRALGTSAGTSGDGGALDVGDNNPSDIRIGNPAG